MKVLLVDDEPLILGALQRVLARTRPEWTVDGAQGGMAALLKMKAHPADLVMADLDMPGLDGIALLTAIRDHYPGTVRIVMSGTGDPDVRLRTVPLAHRFLTKPCEMRDLLKVLDESAPLAVQRTDPLVETIISLDALPSAPPVYAALSSAMANDPSIRDIEEIVMKDQAIAAKVLQIVNSAFFGAPRLVTSLPQALSFLGLSALRSLVLTVEAFKVFDSSKGCAGFSFEEHQVHGLLTARIASRTVLPRERETAFTAGLLHDVGTLILASRVPEVFQEVLRVSRDTCRPVEDVETERMATSHAVVGAQLLGLWGLPGSIVEIVGRHHEPGAFSQGWGAGAAVRVGDVLAHVAMSEMGMDPSGPAAPLLDPALEAGMLEAGGLEALEAIAREEAGRAIMEQRKAS